jgi:hypothetical protein
VSPTAWFDKVGVTGLSIPHLYFAASNFVLWRGGINVKLKFVKTKFHSGRIRIIYVPGFFGGILPVNFETDANYSTVVDIRSDTDVEFNVPYVATVPWLHINSTPWVTSFNQTHACGSIVVEVLNELVNTSTVSDTIEVIVEACAAEDIEFAIPIVPALALRAPPNATSSKGVLDIITSMAQVGTDTGDTPSEVAREEPTSFNEVPLQPTTTTYNASMLMMGEKVTSFRQLIKRFSAVTPPTQNRYWEFKQPFWINPNRFEGLTREGAYDIDGISWFASLYAFYRGSMRYKIAPIDNASPLVVALKPNSLYAGIRTIDIDGTWAYPDYKGAEVFMTPNEGIHELSIPYYSSYPVTLTTYNTSGSDVLDARNGFNRVIARFHRDTNAYVYRAAGDDFSFGFLLGPPIVNHAS